MNNPFKSERSAQERDNPVVPNVVERPVERPIERAAERAATRDNPLVPNAIERPVERAAADDRGAAVNRPDDTRQMDLFPNDELVGYRTRWETVQTGFVDQPRAAVEQAD